MGHFLHERVIPTSALYFAGEATEEEEQDDDEGEEAHQGKGKMRKTIQAVTQEGSRPSGVQAAMKQVVYLLLSWKG